MAVYVYPVLCLLLASPLFQDVLSQYSKFRNVNYQQQDMPLRARGGFNGGTRNTQQRGLQQSRIMPNRGQLSPNQPLSAQGQGSGMMSPYSQSVAISSADAVLSHKSLGPRGRPLHAMNNGPLARDHSQGSFSHVPDMAVGANTMQSAPNPWNQPEVNAPGFIQSRGPLVASPLGGPTLDTLQQHSGSSGPLNQMDSLMIESPTGPLGNQPQFTEPLVPGFVAQSEPAPNQWPSKAPIVSQGNQGSGASKPLSWTPGLKQPLATLPASILIGSEPKYNLASSKPGFEPEAAIVPIKQKNIESKIKDVRLADINTGSNTFSNHQQPIADQFAQKPDVRIMKNGQSNLADYSIIKDTGPTGPLLPGSPAPPTYMYKSTPINVQLNTGSPLTISSEKPQFPLNMATTGIMDMVYQATNTPVFTGAPSGGYTNTWTTSGTTMPPVFTASTAPPTTTAPIVTTTNAYSQISANVMQEKLIWEKIQVLKDLRVALQSLNIPNNGNLYKRIERLSVDKIRAYLKRAQSIKKGRSGTRRSG
ncbi:hypothetical protein KP79_PYT20383 [Mizuhopecten yessoensis]|uniref:Uncharacterized protein n=1 Tax=Mizuhopecten yessoensis TaxID=6573 RepID=A0A210QEL5_MIZYE|nr:hypothetical protein KP79_PYT20383 [Mizuhopecten yessoensis]